MTDSISLSKLLDYLYTANPDQVTTDLYGHLCTMTPKKTDPYFVEKRYMFIHDKIAFLRGLDNEGREMLISIVNARPDSKPDRLDRDSDSDDENFAGKRRVNRVASRGSPGFRD